MQVQLRLTITTHMHSTNSLILVRFLGFLEVGKGPGVKQQLGGSGREGGWGGVFPFRKDNDSNFCTVRFTDQSRNYRALLEVGSRPSSSTEPASATALCMQNDLPSDLLGIANVCQLGLVHSDSLL